MDDWNHARVLLAVFEAGHLGGAAERLGVSAATVSRRLAAAEEALGQVLVERSPRGIELTEAARGLVAPLREAELAMARVVEASRARAQEVAGRVRVACLPSLAADVLCPALPALYAEHPALRVELQLSHRVVNLGRGDVDIAIRSARPEQQNLVARRIAEVPLRAFVARSRLAAGPVAAAALPWIGWPEGLNIAEVRWFEAHVPGAEIVLRVDSVQAQARACEAGVGAALLAAPMAGQYRDLVGVPEAPEGYRLPVWMAATESGRALPRVDAVWRFIEGLAGPMTGHPAA